MFSYHRPHHQFKFSQCVSLSTKGDAPTVLWLQHTSVTPGDKSNIWLFTLMLEPSNGLLYANHLLFVCSPHPSWSFPSKRTARSSECFVYSLTRCPWEACNANLHHVHTFNYLYFSLNVSVLVSINPVIKAIQFSVGFMVINFKLEQMSLSASIKHIFPLLHADVMHSAASSAVILCMCLTKVGCLSYWP